MDTLQPSLVGTSPSVELITKAVKYRTYHCAMPTVSSLVMPQQAIYNVDS